MPFERGSFTLTIFELPGDLPEDLARPLANRHAGTLDEVTGEPQIGWVAGRCLLDTAIDEESIQRGTFYHFALRQAVRKIPSALLNALCRREERIRMKAQNLTFIGSKIRKQIKEEIVEKHIQRMPPSLSAVPAVLAPHEKLLFVGTSGGNQLDLFIDNFYQTFKQEPLQFTPGLILEREFQRTAADFPSLDLGAGDGGEPAIGRDFLMFLWFYGETVGKFVHPQYGDFDVMIEGPLVFAGSGEERGAGETSVRRGDSPLRSAEAKAALEVGKKLKRAKLTVTRGEEIWSGVFDPDNFAFGSFSVPEGEKLEEEEAFIERMEAVVTFKTVLTEYFKLFVDAMSPEKRADTEKKIREWIRNRDAI